MGAVARRTIGAREPPAADEQRETDREERQVVRQGIGDLADVMELEEVMVDDALDQVEQPPSDGAVADQGPPRRRERAPRP
jgi:hypothetical protein